MYKAITPKPRKSCLSDQCTSLVYSYPLRLKNLWSCLNSNFPKCKFLRKNKDSLYLGLNYCQCSKSRFIQNKNNFKLGSKNVSLIILGENLSCLKLAPSNFLNVKFHVKQILEICDQKRLTWVLLGSNLKKLFSYLKSRP